MASPLARPLPLPCGVVLRNRLAKSAMSERLAGPDRAPTAAHATLYGTWGRGGAGLLLTGNVMVDPAHLGERGNVAVEDRAHLEALRAWARASGDTPQWVQLNHPGRQAPRRLDPAPVAPSAIAVAGAGGLFATPTALDEAGIERIVERFATSAAIVKEAGFHGVQIHAAHGYLCCQFLSPRTNVRTDRWGGDLEGRSRFLREVVTAVRRAVGPGFPVGVKLNTADFQKGGFTEEEGVEVARRLQDLGIDLLELSGGTYERAVMFAEGPPRESTLRREAFFLDQAEKVRAAVKTPLLLTGGFRTRAAMEGALESGAVDVVGLARPLCLEPDLPARLLAGQADAARPVTLHTGIAAIDAMLTGAWYEVQLARMGRGLPPDPGVWRLTAIATYVRDLYLP
jgi:2,4-dienoyl-CoA reductase-like NADH-dependent reductase (Old Yellow Enzyme family)